MKDSRKKPALVLLTLLGGVAIVLAPVLFTSRSLFPCHTDCFDPWALQAAPEERERADRTANLASTDKLFMFHPEIVHSRNEMLSGRLPGWNPYVLGGLPHIATGIPAAFSPLMVVHLVLDPFSAYGVVAALQLLMAGLFSYLFLRALGIGSPGALFGAACFAFGGWMAARMEYYQIAGAAAWVPMAFFGLERFLASGKGRYAAFLALGVGFSFLSGFPQITIEALYLMGAFTLFRVPGLRRSLGPFPALRRLLILGGALFLGFMVSAPQMAPGTLFTLGGHSTREVGRDPALKEAVRLRALHPGALTAFLMPEALGHPHLPKEASCPPPLLEGRTLLGQVWMGRYSNFNEMTVYMGILAACLVLGAWRLWRMKQWIFFLAAAIIGILASLDTWLFDFCQLLPGLNIGDPKRFLFITVFALSCAAALAFENHLKGVDERGSSKAPAFAAWALTLVSAGIAIWLLLSGTFPKTVIPRLAGIYGVTPEKAAEVLGPEALEGAADHLLRCLWVLTGTAGAAGIVLFLSGMKKLSLPLRVLLPLLFLMTELGYFALDLNRGQDTSDFLRPTPLTTWLEKRNEEETFRIARFRDVDVPTRTVLMPKLPMLSGIEDVQGYVGIYLKRYRELIDGLEPGLGKEPRLTRSVGMMSFKEISTLASPVFDLLGVRYLLARDAPTDLPPKFEKLEPIDGITILQNNAALPRAFVVQKVRCAAGPDESLAALFDDDFDPREEAVVEGRVDFSAWSLELGKTFRTEVTRAGASEVVVDVESGGGLLVLTENHYPAWKAEVDGEAAKVYYTNHAFRGVPVPPGRRTVTFRYKSAPITFGLIAGLVGIVAIGFLLLLGSSKKGPERWKH